MHIAARAAIATWRYALTPLAQYWTALENDYKSIACAIVILGAVVGLELQIPW